MVNIVNTNRIIILSMLAKNDPEVKASQSDQWQSKCLGFVNACLYVTLACANMLAKKSVNRDWPWL